MKTARTRSLRGPGRCRGRGRGSGNHPGPGGADGTRSRACHGHVHRHAAPSAAAPSKVASVAWPSSARSARGAAHLGVQERVELHGHDDRRPGPGAGRHARRRRRRGRRPGDDRHHPDRCPLGLDRIDQRNRPLSGTYTYTATGSGVRAYVIDTGIRFAHRLRRPGHLGLRRGRRRHGRRLQRPRHPRVVDRRRQHLRRGQARTPVGCGCSTARAAATSGVVAGIDWAAGNHAAGTPAVANLSLGGGASTSIDSAINRLNNDGVTVVVAAGNSSASACNSSPARVPAALTVAATTAATASPRSPTGAAASTSSPPA